MMSELESHGFFFLAGGMLQGFWYDGSAYHTLDAPVPGVISTAAYGISGNDIVDLVGPVPEPGTIVLTTAGLLGLVRRRRMARR